MDHDMLDVVDPFGAHDDYSCHGFESLHHQPPPAPLPTHKHYVVPDYAKESYVIGATADVIRLDYPTESRDRIQQQQQQAGAAGAVQPPRVAAAAGAGPTPHIHYHVYESPQLTT